MTNGRSFIAGSRTDADWRAFRATLTGSRDTSRWRDAFDGYFRARLESRYFGPIKLLQEHGTWEGEGFSILAKVVRGNLPRRAARLVVEWLEIRRGELLADWNLAQSGLPLARIEPLD